MQDKQVAKSGEISGCFGINDFQKKWVLIGHLEMLGADSPKVSNLDSLFQMSRRRMGVQGTTEGRQESCFMAFEGPGTFAFAEPFSTHTHKS